MLIKAHKKPTNHILSPAVESFILFVFSVKSSNKKAEKTANSITEADGHYWSERVGMFYLTIEISVHVPPNYFKIFHVVLCLGISL